MSTNTYPALRLAVLNGLITLKEQMDNDDQFLAASPYDNETKDILERLLTKVVVEVPVEKIITVTAKPGRGRPTKDVQLSEEDEIQIQNEIRDLMAALNTMGTGEGLEVSQRLAITKNKTDLLDRLLKMRERETTVRKTEEFKEVIITMLESQLDEKGREVFMQRLDALR